MIIDKLENADRYACLHPGFAEAFKLLREFDFEAAEDGKHDIDGERLAIVVIRAPGKPRDEVQLEAHERYIDIQYVVSGSEHFSWMRAADCEKPIGAFDTEKDVIKYEDEPDGWFPLTAGTFVVFFPEDAHGPMAGEGHLDKLVVKLEV